MGKATGRSIALFELVSILFAQFIFTFVLNFFWEAIHAVYLYRHHDFEAATYVPMLVYVAATDGLLVLGLYAVIGLLWWNPFWIRSMRTAQVIVYIVAGAGMSAIIEYLNVFVYHRWAYLERMPTIFGIGLSPLVQLSLTGQMAVWLARQIFYARGLFTRRPFD